MSHPYCLQNKHCLEYIIDNVAYLFDDTVMRIQIESFVKALPITVNKQLIKKEPFDISTVDDELKEKILSLPITPIDFLIHSVATDYPANLQELQKNPKMISLGKEIRKRNFSKKLIERLARLAEYFAIFFYESRTHTIWRAVLDSVIKAPFTPENLLQYLDTLYRRDAAEYIKFYALLSQNSSLTRVIYLIDAMQDDEHTGKNQQETEGTGPETEEIMSIPKLNHYAHHWFPDIVLSSIKKNLIYKTTLEKVYEELHDWKERNQFAELFNNYPMYQEVPENPQKINPLYNDILYALLNHKKVPAKILQQEVDNNDPMIRKLIALAPNSSLPILNKLQTDGDKHVRTIAIFYYTLRKKEKELQKAVEKEESEDRKKNNTLILPKQILDNFKGTKETDYY